MKSDIVSFDFVRINRARGKICKCNPPHYEVTNRIVTCSDCGAVIQGPELCKDGRRGIPKNEKKQSF